MATQEALAIACNRACVRIEEAVSALTGEGVKPLPRVHKDREILRKQQLEIIADLLESLQKPKKTTKRKSR